MTKDDIIKILDGWEFGATLATGEQVRGVKREYWSDVANEILEKVNNSVVLDGVVDTDCEHENTSREQLWCDVCDDCDHVEVIE